MPGRAALALIPSTFVENLGLPTISHLERSFDTLDLSRPVNLVTAQLDDMDPTSVDMECVEHFEVRQVTEDGEVHIVLLSKPMVIEMMGLMNAWVSIG